MRSIIADAPVSASDNVSTTALEITIMTNAIRRAAVIGGVRIPFARSNTAYVHVGNLDMLTAALTGLVDKYALSGETIGEVAAGAPLQQPPAPEDSAHGAPRHRVESPTP